MAKLITPGGSSFPVEPANGKFTLNEMYTSVECETVEFVYLSDGGIMIIDEDGKNKDKPLNSEATMIAEQDLFPGDYIVGNALLCDSNEID